jgi:hypothetical protein
MQATAKVQARATRGRFGKTLRDQQEQSWKAVQENSRVGTQSNVGR